MKERLDVKMVREAITPSREQARRLILEGKVLVDGKVAAKAGMPVEDSVQIRLAGAVSTYVGRGGEKLAALLSRYSISLEGMTCMDVGASTGGFTDCMLQHGAKQVYAVDVGSGQLAKKLLEDQRVVNVEHTNVRYLKPEHFGVKMDFVSMDVSFISVTKLFPAVALQMRCGAELACLIKPQFEAGRGALNKHGIVFREKPLHTQVLRQTLSSAVASGFLLLHLDVSPILGGDGNIEYLLHARLTGDVSGADWIQETERVVDEAFLYHCQSGKGRK